MTSYPIPVVLSHPSEFKTGYRILLLTLRGKDGGKNFNPDRVAKKYVTRNEKEFDEKLEELIGRRTGEERIYSTIDERDIEKAIRLFKQRQLDADYYDVESKHSFYVDVWNRFISSLQSPNAKKGTLFLVDVDYDHDDEADIRKQIEEKKIEIVYEYQTKNGVHLILKPFNPGIVTFSVLKNSLMLWVYGKVPRDINERKIT